MSNYQVTPEQIVQLFTEAKIAREALPKRASIAIQQLKEGRSRGFEWAIYCIGLEAEFEEYCRTGRLTLPPQ